MCCYLSHFARHSRQRVLRFMYTNKNYIEPLFPVFFLHMMSWKLLQAAVKGHFLSKYVLITAGFFSH